MTDNKIKKLIAGGFSNTEIKAMIDKEERQIAEAKASALALKVAEEKARLLQEQMDEEDEPADTGVSFAKLQEAFNKTWVVDAKINEKVDSNTKLITAIPEQTVKDLTHLTTQDEIYNAIKTGGWYKVKTTASETAIVTCTYKPTTQAYLAGISSDETYGLSAKMVYTIIRVGHTTPITYINSPTVIGEPRADNNAATKKYVDDSMKAIKPFQVQSSDVKTVDMNGVKSTRIEHKLSKAQAHGIQGIQFSLSRTSESNRGWQNNFMCKFGTTTLNNSSMIWAYNSQYLYFLYMDKVEIVIDETYITFNVSSSNSMWIDNDNDTGGGGGSNMHMYNLIFNGIEVII